MCAAFGRFVISCASLKINKFKCKLFKVTIYYRFDFVLDNYIQFNVMIFYICFSLPKPVFQSTKKFSNHMKNGHQIEETLSPQHEEIVKYIHESEYYIKFINFNFMVKFMIGFTRIYCVQFKVEL